MTGKTKDYEDIRILKADLRWHAVMLIWALNRCQNTLHDLTQLIKSASCTRLERYQLGAADPEEPQP